MKKIIILLIRAYQITPFIGHKMCRFYPTCSEYMIIAIENYGVIKGISMGLKRIKRCRPKGDVGYDPVPTKEENFEKK